MSPLRELTVERIAFRLLEAPAESAVQMSFGSITMRRAFLVEVTAQGVTGVGETWVNHPDWGWRERVATLEDGIAPLMLGMALSHPSQAHVRLAEKLVGIGRQWNALGPIYQAISGVDMALWDLFAKLEQVPVSRLLRAEATGAEGAAGVPFYASGVGPTDVRALCEEAMSLGANAVKAKVGFGEERDRATLRSIRDVCGDGIGLFMDANRAWNAEDSTTARRLAEDFGVEWIEEPLADAAPAALRDFSIRSGRPVALGENLYGPDGFTPFLGLSGIAELQPDVAKCGGLTVAWDVVTRAEAARASVSPHWYGAATGLAASLALATASGSVRWMEMDMRANPLRTELYENPYVLEGGLVRRDEAVGLNGPIRSQTVEKFQTYCKEFTR
ncbi:hypothetical protein SA2016_0899 [Sinomonas atrocyanea]|uniref:Mandelate racemase/muconate lactonizing enzyme C-terminal domain-containing protein n=1 Tax=Sinomonas atrocyanea TaxID=37927 RepID=A0A126ZX98_9MICC|nr:enolase C-terminal domain-like protein [Sinomonas atrocyanea]AMM31587.1 hypothetical protein SA2016_0899 [Sinomonas atrocyanea]GEB66554.1 mandelate racemase [Sinomonas atrocyanea]GGG57795.1 mandelate racemase [Sinomonas atrocyanea]